MKKIRKNGWGLVVIIGLMVGVGFTIIDYSRWRHAEMDRFGQGWGDLSKPALALGVMYENQLVGVRLHVPQSWKVVENPEMRMSRGDTLANKVKLDQRVVVADLGADMKLEVERKKGNLTDIVDEKVNQLKRAGTVLSKEREYISTNKLNLTVLTWEENLEGGKANMHQEAWAMKGDRVVILVAEVPEEHWSDLNKTFWEVYQNAEMIY